MPNELRLSLMLSWASAVDCCVFSVGRTFFHFCWGLSGGMVFSGVGADSGWEGLQGGGGGDGVSFCFRFRLLGAVAFLGRDS